MSCKSLTLRLSERHGITWESTVLNCISKLQLRLLGPIYSGFVAWGRAREESRHVK